MYILPKKAFIILSMQGLGLEAVSTGGSFSAYDRLIQYI